MAVHDMTFQDMVAKNASTHPNKTAFVHSDEKLGLLPDMNRIP